MAHVWRRRDLTLINSWVSMLRILDLENPVLGVRVVNGLESLVRCVPKAGESKIERLGRLFAGGTYVYLPTVNKWMSLCLTQDTCRSIWTNEGAGRKGKNSINFYVWLNPKITQNFPTLRFLCNAGFCRLASNDHKEICDNVEFISRAQMSGGEPKHNLMNEYFMRCGNLSPHLDYLANLIFFSLLDKLNPRFQIETNKCVSIILIWAMFGYCTDGGFVRKSRRFIHEIAAQRWR